MTNWIKNFLNPTAQLVGLDIGSHSVKLIQLSQHRKRYCLENYAIFPFLKDSTDALLLTLKEVKQYLPRLNQPVAIAVSDTVVIKKTISVDKKLTEAEVSDQILLTLDDHVSYPLEEISFDFQILGTNHENPNQKDVLLVVSRKENVMTEVAKVEGSGLKVKVVDVQSFALTRIFQHLELIYRNGLYMVVDIGAVNMSIVIVLHGEPVFIHHEHFGGQHLTQIIHQHYGLSLQEAETAKQNNQLPSGYYKEILIPFYQQIAFFIQQSCKLFNVEKTINNVVKIFLAGGSALLPNIAIELNKIMGFNVALINPFINIDIAQTISKENLLKDAPKLLLCCGLALHRFPQFDGDPSQKTLRMTTYKHSE